MQTCLFWVHSLKCWNRSNCCITIIISPIIDIHNFWNNCFDLLLTHTIHYTWMNVIIFKIFIEWTYWSSFLSLLSFNSNWPKDQNHHFLWRKLSWSSRIKNIEERKTFQKVPFDKQIIQISSGFHHILVLTGLYFFKY